MSTSPDNHRQRPNVDDEEEDDKNHSSLRMISCCDCGKVIPPGNLLMHQLRGCIIRNQEQTVQIEPEIDVQRSEPQDDNDDDPMDIDEPEPSSVPVTSIDHQQGVIDIASIDDSTVGDDDDSTSDEVEIVPSQRAGTTIGGDGGDDDDDSNMKPSASPSGTHDPPSSARSRRRRAEVVDLVNSTESSPKVVSSLSNEAVDRWACPRCTLLNPLSSHQCNACLSRRPDHHPDPPGRASHVDFGTSLFTPVTVDDDDSLSDSLQGFPGTLENGGPPLMSALEAAVSAAFGGTLGNDVMPQGVTTPHRRSYRHEAWADPGTMNVSQARTSSGISGGYPSVDSFRNFSAGRNQGQSSQRVQQEGNPALQGIIRAATRPRSSFRVEYTRDLDGSMTTVIMGGRSSTTIREGSRLPMGTMGDQMRNYLLHAMLDDQTHNGQNANRQNVDDMGYEELLRAFGDGTENLGANEEQIESLPTHTIHDPEKELPEDARGCLICLEDFVKGDKRKMLPCLHGFHVDCCDKWLKTNGSCPICKHRI